MASCWRLPAWHGSGPMIPGVRCCERLLQPLPRMVLPLSVCPTAPAQGALGIECRAEDAGDRAFAGATSIMRRRGARSRPSAHCSASAAVAVTSASAPRRSKLPGLGALLYLRDDADAARPQLRRTPRALDACDGREPGEPSAPGTAAAPQRADDRTDRTAGIAAAPSALSGGTGAVRRPSHGRCPRAMLRTHPRRLPVWVPGLDDAGRRWPSAASGSRAAPTVWALRAANRCCAEPLLQLPPRDQWTVLTHAGCASTAGRPAR